jgi:DNA-binding NarL/FixJ family response regulator
MLKTGSGAQLIEAIRDIYDGRSYLSPHFTDRGLDDYLPVVDEPCRDPVAALTAREVEVLHLSAEGLTARQIATRLSISHRTVEAHKHNLLRKLGLHSQTDLVRFAVANGVVELQSA